MKLGRVLWLCVSSSVLAYAAEVRADDLPTHEELMRKNQAPTKTEAKVEAKSEVEADAKREVEADAKATAARKTEPGGACRVGGSGDGGLLLGLLVLAVGVRRRSL